MGTSYKAPRDPTLAERNWQIRLDRSGGKSLRALASRYGLSVTHVQRIVIGVPIFARKRPRQARKPPPERSDHWLRWFQLRNRARELRKRGYSYRQIATMLGISKSCAFEAACMVKITSLEGRAWLSHADGRPRAWKRELLARTRPPEIPNACNGLAVALDEKLEAIGTRSG